MTVLPSDAGSIAAEAASLEPLFAGPTHVDLDLTNACNLACSHCHAASGAALPNELRTAELLDVIDQLHAAGTLNLTIAGGEPFHRRDILELLSYATHLPAWSVTVISNGSFFTSQLAQALLDRCPGLRINVSIDGSTAKRFSVFRHQAKTSQKLQDALFSRVLDGTRRVVETGLQVGVNYTLTRANVDDLPATYDMAINDLGVRDMLAIKFFPGGHGNRFRDLMEFPYSDWASALVHLTELKSSGAFPALSVAVPSAWEFYMPLLEAGYRQTAVERLWGYHGALVEPVYARNRSVGDASGIGDLNVGADGKVYPTVLMAGNPEALCGDLHTSRLLEVWRSAPVLQRLRELTVDDIGASCAGCSLVRLCGGGSRSRSLLFGRGLHGPDLSCPRLAEA